MKRKIAISFMAVGILLVGFAMGLLIYNNYENEIEMLISKYDALFYLETPAGSNVEFYTLENNPARSETPSEASEIAIKTLEAWQKHNKLINIKIESRFEDKIAALISEIEQLI